MRKSFTTIASDLMVDVRDLVDWGIAGKHTDQKRLRLTVAARQQEAKKLIASGVSKRKVGKMLGVDKRTVGRDVGQNAPKSGAKRPIRKKKPNGKQLGVNEVLIQEPHPDQEATTEDRWTWSVQNIASDVVSCDPHWNREFPDWESYKLPSDVLQLVKEAAEAWEKLKSKLLK
jgi:hypothetical protein